MSRRYIVGVMGPAAAGPETIDMARELGRLIAIQGWVVLSGGRNTGVMKGVNEGAKEVEGSITVGILPSSRSDVCPSVDIPIVTDIHSARNNVNVLSSDIVVACGEGGAGTASEIALALKASRRVIILGASQQTVAFFRRLSEELIYPADSPQEVIEKIKSLR